MFTSAVMQYCISALMVLAIVAAAASLVELIVTIIVSVYMLVTAPPELKSARRFRGEQL